MKRSCPGTDGSRKRPRKTKTCTHIFFAVFFVICMSKFILHPPPAIDPVKLNVTSDKCVFCDRTIAGSLRNGSRIVNLAATNEHRKEVIENWCHRNQLETNDVDGRWCCGRDSLRISNNKLPDLQKTKNSQKPPIIFCDAQTDPCQSSPSPSPKHVTLHDVTNVPNSGRKCVVCDEKVVKGCTKVPYWARMELLIDYELLIPPESNCRICKSHLNGEHLVHDLKVTRKYTEKDCSMSEENAESLIKELIEGMKKYRNLPHLNFEENSNMTDCDYNLWTGWTKSQFDDMVLELKGINNSHVRSKREALGMFWVKLKTDLSFAQIASLFNLKDPNEGGRLTVSRAVHSVAESLNNDFVPQHLGVDHISPDEARTHNTIYSNTFWGDLPTTIWDGTYLYIHKSGNYSKGTFLCSFNILVDNFFENFRNFIDTFFYFFKPSCAIYSSWSVCNKNLAGNACFFFQANNLFLQKKKSS
eukprot:Lithocolla_globosa_v1_NODE_3443_length_1667_cov_3.710918.p1 type:complete len:472 gc:universal NODE_3443_length_1667_cov_3.710918:1499-84(-)